MIKQWKYRENIKFFDGHLNYFVYSGTDRRVYENSKGEKNVKKKQFLDEWRVVYND